MVVRQRRGKIGQHTEDQEDLRTAERVLDRIRGGEERTVPLKDATSVSRGARRKRQTDAVRLLSESLRLAREHGSTATLDSEFGKDVEAGIESHRK